MTAITTSNYYGCALTTSGVKCWGSISSGNVPVDIAGMTGGVGAIALGLGDTCWVTTTGGVKCWGDNYYGELGNGSTTRSSDPVDVVGLSDGVTAITAGPQHNCALTGGGGVKCWGWNSSGQLGNGSTINSSVPVDVAGLAGGVAAIAAGDSHSAARWGSQLGDGTTTDSSTPVDVKGL